MHDQSKFIIAAVGIFFSYFYFGILQEKITRGRYGDSRNEDGSYGEKFTYTLTLVGVQCLWNWIFAKGLLRVPISAGQLFQNAFASFVSFRFIDNETGKRR